MENKKPISELEKLNTKNLLRFYKKERKRFYGFVGGLSCECCGEWMWEINPDLYNKEEEMVKKEAWQSYLDDIKAILNTREHIE